MILKTSYKMKPPVSARLIRGHPLSKGLVGWLFNEGSGNKVFDLSRNGYNGSIVTPDWISGSIGPALNMVDGSNNYITFTNKGLITSSSAFTVIFRSKPVSNQENMAFAFTQAAAYPGFGLPYVIVNNRPLLFMDANNYRYFSADSPTNYLDGSSHTFAVVMPGNAQADINNALLYIDGIAQDIISTRATEAQTARTDFLIGSTGLYGRHFTGSFEYFYFYNRVLFASEISLVLREPFCMFERLMDPLFSIAGAPPEIQALYMDLSTQLWTIKHSTGLFTKL